MTGCKKSGAGNAGSLPVTTVKDIYVAGNAISSAGKNVALCWMNDVATYLTDPQGMQLEYAFLCQATMCMWRVPRIKPAAF